MSLAAVVDARLDAAMDRAVARYFSVGKPVDPRDLENALGMRLDARVNALWRALAGRSPATSPASLSSRNRLTRREIVIRAGARSHRGVPPEWCTCP